MPVVTSYYSVEGSASRLDLLPHSTPKRPQRQWTYACF